MPYKYDFDKGAVVDLNDDSIYLTIHVGGREVSASVYMLTWGDLRIGISNAGKDGNAIIPPNRPDGTAVYYLTQIGVRVDGLVHPWPILTNFSGFKSKDQQDKFLQILHGIFEGINGYPPHMAAGIAKGELVIDPELQKRLDDGEFFK